MKKISKSLLAIATCCLMAFTLTACSKESSSKYTDGTYSGTAKGMNGDVTAEVTVISDKIETVNLTSHNETIGISDPTIEQISTFIVGKNLAEVDIVACATLTSNAIIQAVTQALDKATGLQDICCKLPFKRNYS